MCAPDHLPDPLLPNPMGDASEQPPHGLSSVYDSDSRYFFYCLLSYHYTYFLGITCESAQLICLDLDSQ